MVCYSCSQAKSSLSVMICRVLQTQKLSRGGRQWYGEFTVTNAKVMYASRNDFDYINASKNLAIAVSIPENASLQDCLLAAFPGG